MRKKKEDQLPVVKNYKQIFRCGINLIIMEETNKEYIKKLKKKIDKFLVPTIEKL